MCQIVLFPLWCQIVLGAILSSFQYLPNCPLFIVVPNCPRCHIVLGQLGLHYWWQFVLVSFRGDFGPRVVCHLGQSGSISASWHVSCTKDFNFAIVKNLSWIFEPLSKWKLVPDNLGPKIPLTDHRRGTFDHFDCPELYQTSFPDVRRLLSKDHLFPRGSKVWSGTLILTFDAIGDDMDNMM